MPAKSKGNESKQSDSPVRKGPAPFGRTPADAERKTAILRAALARFGLPTDAAVKAYSVSPFTQDFAPDEGAPAAGRSFRMGVAVPWPTEEKRARQAMAAALSIEDGDGRAVVKVDGAVARVFL